MRNKVKKYKFTWTKERRKNTGVTGVREEKGESGLLTFVRSSERRKGVNDKNSSNLNSGGNNRSKRIQWEWKRGGDRGGVKFSLWVGGL